jgi:hypothetical protein
MKKNYFFLTIDTELDHRRYRISPNSARNLEKLYSLVEYVSKNSIYLTLFVTYNIVKYHSNVLRDLLQSDFVELGVHLHPEEMPENLAQGIHSSSLFDYPIKTLEDFLDLFFDSFIENEFAVPSIFRAGRYRLPLRLIPSLLKRNITVDSSVTPYINWSLENGPDYSQIPVSINNYNGIKEVPITIVLPEHKKKNYLYRKIGTIPMFSKPPLVRQLRRVLLGKEPLWLRPTFEDVDGLKHVIFLSQKSHPKYACMMFHSYELKEQCSPQSKSKEDAQLIYNRLIEFLDQLGNLNVISIPMKNIAN